MARRSRLVSRAAVSVAAAGAAVLVGGCGAHVPNPAFRAGYQEGLQAYSQFLQQYAPLSTDRLQWLCYSTAYRRIQSMTNDYAVHWQEGWNRGCAGKGP